MSSIRIHPLHLGTITRYKDSMMFKIGYGVRMDFPILAFYLEGAGKKILVDTGGCDPQDPVHGPHRAPYVREKDQDVVSALRKKVGVDPDEIDIVINNHLHWDHCAGNDLFPNAEIIVQKRELESALNPVPLLSVAYIRKYLEEVRYTTVDGDREIVPGVSVLLTPGHTEGLQCVLVETPGKRYLLTGDCVPLYESMNHNPPWPNGLFVNLREYYETQVKVSKLGASIIPGHDMKVLETEVYE
ncbi:MAG TPA: N-acyl homoserine lactonase family protein [Deltaproteobacteria bacterium]|nr:N-acyl homoserine lactonase family protein [Deltaproteobacteria bacterium]HPR53718.1 N-acyl homoserine lactonase family protein [Deltaproteobacteria bacterium]HXK47584.1 N-acyl homoserine lactonase family protein [Deltaproteobacteria bacterium]